MSDISSRMSVVDSLPAVIPPTTRFNFIKNWWHRSNETSSVAEARIIKRIYGALPLTTNLPLSARIGRVPIDKQNDTKQVNTLYISQKQNSSTNFEFQHDVQDDELLKIMKEETNAETKNLVMCHGYGAGLGFFYRNYQALAQISGYRLFSIDWLGMGRSSRPKWTIAKKSNETWDEIVKEVEDHFVQSLEDWRESIGLEKMTLLGHSLGGYFATCYALQYPQRVEKLVLVSPAGIAKNPHLKPEQENLTPEKELEKEAAEIGATMQANAAAVENIARQTPLGDTQENQENQDTKPPGPRRKIPGWATYLWDKNVTPMTVVRMIGPFGPALVNRYASRRFAHLSEEEQHDLYDYLYNITSSTGSGEYALAAILAPGAYARKPLMERLAKLKMPTVFIYGEQDWMDYKAAEKAKEAMDVPVKIVRIPNGGHHMYLENPEEFNKVMEEELTQS